MTVSTISRIERGLTNPRWDTVAKIAHALEISLSDLSAELGRSPGEAPEP